MTICYAFTSVVGVCHLAVNELQLFISLECLCHPRRELVGYRLKFVHFKPVAGNWVQQNVFEWQILPGVIE